MTLKRLGRGSQFACVGLGLGFWRLIRQPLQLLDGTAGGQPIADVAFGREVGKMEDANGGRDAGELTRHVLRMRFPGLVVVCQYHDVPITEVLGVGTEPLTCVGLTWNRLACAARVAGRNQPVFAQIVRVFRTFDNVDRGVGG
jgi:hypothetical protein